MRIFNGKKNAEKILKNIGEKIKEEKTKPILAVIMVGENESSKLYLKLKKKAAAKIGIEVKEYIFNSQTKEEEIIDKIKELNNDSKTNGIIVQLPLPSTLNTDKIIGTINPLKDVDGFSETNRQLLKKGEAKLKPVLPTAIHLAIEAALKNEARNKKILALVNSDIFGQTLKLLLEKEGLKSDYLVRNTCIVLGAENKIKAADILIVACGCPNFIKGDVIKDGAVLIDAGITRFHDGRVVGDIDRESVKNKASFLTPVPGGIGPLTIALLLKNVYLAAKLSLAENQSKI